MTTIIRNVKIRADARGRVLRSKLRTRSAAADSAVAPRTKGIRTLNPSTVGLVRQAANTVAAIIGVLDTLDESQVRRDAERNAEHPDTPEAGAFAASATTEENEAGAPVRSETENDEEAALAPELQQLLAQLEAASESFPVAKLNAIRSDLETRLRAMKKLSDVQSEMAAFTDGGDPTAMLAQADAAISGPTAGREGRGAALREIVAANSQRVADAYGAIAAAEAGMSRAISDAYRVRYGMDAAPWTDDDLYEFFRVKGFNDTKR